MPLASCRCEFSKSVGILLYFKGVILNCYRDNEYKKLLLALFVSKKLFHNIAMQDFFETK